MSRRESGNIRNLHAKRGKRGTRKASEKGSFKCNRREFHHAKKKKEEGKIHKRERERERGKELHLPLTRARARQGEKETKRGDAMPLLALLRNGISSIAQERGSLSLSCFILIIFYSFNYFYYFIYSFLFS